MLPRLGRKLILLYLLCFISAIGTGQASSEPKTSMLKYSWRNPAQSEVISYLHDSRSVMWMLTSADVFSFDGVDFISFRARFPELRLVNVVRAGEDIAGNIWLVGIRNSRITVYVFNPILDILQPLHIYLGLKAPFVLSCTDNRVIFFNIQGKIWFGNAEQAFLYDGKLRQVYKSSTPVSKSTSWWPGRYGFWTAGWLNGMLYLEDSTGQIKDSISHQHASLWIDDQLNLWGAARTKQHGWIAPFFKVTQAQGKIQKRWIETLPSFPWMSDINVLTTSNMSARYGMNAYYDSEKYYLNRNGKEIEIDLSDKNRGDLNLINPFYFDREGGLWSSTRTEVYRIIFKNKLPFKTWLQDPSLDFSVRGMAQLDNWLYIHSYKGEYRLDLNNYTLERFPWVERQGIVLYEKDGTLWSGGHGGKIRCLKPDGSIRDYSLSRFTDVYCFLKTNTGKILVGTANGLYVIDETNQTPQPTRFMAVNIACLYSNHQGIWAGTGNGLYRINEEGVIQAHYLKSNKKLIFNHLQHILEDYDGSFWIATRGGGLIHWFPNSNQYKQYTTSDGLSNNDIHAVYADAFGFLWLPSNDGLMRFHKSSGQVKAYYKEDGLADSEFNSFSHFQAGDGRIFLGGVNGVTAFEPKEIPIQKEESGSLKLLEVKSFQLKNGGTFTSQLKSALKDRIIAIQPKDSYLELKVSPLLYETADNVRYAWKLDGVHNEWIQQPSSVIRLSNIPYGKYVLRVRYSMQDNNWFKKEYKLTVLVKRPFYKQWYFTALLILALISFGWLLNSWRNHQLIQANARLEAEVNKRTEQIETDKALITRQAQELQSLDEMKTRFFANVTHELRTPLTMIIGPIERILQGRIKPDKIDEHLQTIQRNALRQLNLVEELLDLSRIDANKLSLQLQPTHFFDLVSRLLSAFTPYAEHRNVELRLYYKPSKDLIYLLDASKWEKIINNLLDNALKFTPGEGLIAVSVFEEGSQLKIQVSDTGQGIHPDELPFIFDRYFQSKMGDTLHGGAGIGLSLCREYVHLFGGELTVESTPGKGSIFTISFTPVLYKEHNSAPYISTDQVVLNSEAPINPATHFADRKTLLLVEDDKETLDYLRSILESDYNLLSAYNGRLALEYLQANPVDLIVSDVMMPEMDGFQLLKAIREKATDIPFILLTARVEATDRLNALRLGVDDYLTKPFIDEELTVRIKNLIKRQQTRRLLRLTADAKPDGDLVIPFDQKWLERLEKLVFRHLSDPMFSVQRMADGMHISERSLRYKVKAYTGLNPNQYLLEARLERARLLLENKSYETISEVCFAVGLTSQRYFSKLIKDHFGKLPSEF